jgi:LacI family transcriptional regulator
MKRIAELAQVSTATVSKIINQRDSHISQETRKRVLDLVETYGYRPNAIAKGLKEKKTNTIGFILPDISNPFFPEIARGIEDVAKSEGFAVVFCNTDNDAQREQDSVLFLQSKMVDGLIFTRSLRESSLEQYLSANMPIVVVDRGMEISNRKIGKVYINTRSAIRDATQLLLDRGCQRVGFISALDGSPQDRYEGYCDALAEHGLAVEQELVFDGEYSVSTGSQGAQRLLQNRVDGIVCGNDLIATGVMRAAEEYGLRIPRDLKVIGLDDIYFSKYLHPPLTTIEQPAYEMGRDAAKMLICNILYGEPLFVRELPYRMILRETV